MPGSPIFSHLPSGSRTERICGYRKSDEVKMKSTSGLACMAASRFASAVARVPLGGHFDHFVEQVRVLLDHVS